MSKVNYKPTFNKIIVKLENFQEQTTKAGLIIPTMVDDRKFKTGHVVAVGQGYRTEKGTFIKTVVDVGDYVMFTGLAALPIKIDGEEYFMMPDQEVLAVIEKVEE